MAGLPWTDVRQRVVDDIYDGLSSGGHATMEEFMEAFCRAVLIWIGGEKSKEETKVLPPLNCPEKFRGFGPQNDMM